MPCASPPAPLLKVEGRIKKAKGEIKLKRYHDKNWTENMKIKFDFNNMMSEYIGEQGIDISDIKAMSEAFSKAHGALQEKRKNGGMDWRDLPYNQNEDIKKILVAAKQIRETFDTFVVIGIGGQALGPIAVQYALNHLNYNELPKEKRGGPKFYVPDNCDPERLNALFDVIDIAKTKFFISSKSGSTSETMSQFMIIVELLKKKLGYNYKENIICITDSETGNLIKIVKREGYEWFVMPRGVGGRFSELSASGLLPAAVCGIDIEEMLAGGALMDEVCNNPDVFKNPAYIGAVLQYLAIKKGKNISVMMPYADSLKYISDWYAQLWAESLGKKFNNEGREVFAGQTPVKALGVTDQHSQMQLYAEGPFDKVITFIRVENYRNDATIPVSYEDIPGLAFLGSHTMSELIKTEQFATEYALLKAKKLNNTIILPEVNPFTIGQLLYMFEVQTAFIGELLNINAFDQPGVEEGKNATYALIGRPGYDEKKAELDAAPKKSEKYVI